MILSIFSGAFCSFVYFFWEKSLFRSAHFLIIIFFNIEFHELLVYSGDFPLLVALFANIFSHSKGCLSILFMISFAMQKLLS